MYIDAILIIMFHLYNFNQYGMLFKRPHVQPIDSQFRTKTRQTMFLAPINMTQTWLSLVVRTRHTLLNDDQTYHPKTSIPCHCRSDFVVVMVLQWITQCMKESSNCDVVAWEAVFISSDIGFIHTNMYGRSCKKYYHIWIFTRKADVTHYWDTIICPDKGLSPVKHQWPLLLTWFNFNPSMDK